MLNILIVSQLKSKLRNISVFKFSGNEWLVRNLGVVPKSGWAIDPFGHSSTMTYILKKMNFENMLIQRVHYAIKKHFSLEKTLEFRFVFQDWCFSYSLRRGAFTLDLWRV